VRRRWVVLAPAPQPPGAFVTRSYTENVTRLPPVNECPPRIHAIAQAMRCVADEAGAHAKSFIKTEKTRQNAGENTPSENAHAECHARRHGIERVIRELEPKHFGDDLHHDFVGAAADGSETGIDERTAGFLALGLARGSGRPTVVVTTSGTAVANLHPAVLEAHHGGVPLLVLSADRPPWLRDVGANQTVEQRPIEPALVNDGSVTIVTKGVSAGDQVVVNGQYRLQAGARVEARTEQATAVPDQ